MLLIRSASTCFTKILSTVLWRTRVAFVVAQSLSIKIERLMRLFGLSSFDTTFSHLVSRCCEFVKNTLLAKFYKIRIAKNNFGSSGLHPLRFASSDGILPRIDSHASQIEAGVRANTPQRQMKRAKQHIPLKCPSHLWWEVDMDPWRLRSFQL